MRTAARFSNLADALSVQLVLSSSGIESVVNEGRISDPIPTVQLGSIHGVPVSVEDGDFDTAKEIIDQWRKAVAEREGNPPYTKYWLPCIIMGVLFVPFSSPWYVGLLSGIFLASIITTIYNIGVEKGYKAAKRDIEQDSSANPLPPSAPEDR